MIKIEQGEAWAFNIINANTQKIQEELERCFQAQQSYISLLENKYNATFNQKTGQFEEKKTRGEKT